MRTDIKGGLVIIPFGCVSLCGLFRCKQTTFQKGENIALCRFAFDLMKRERMYEEFDEETLVLAYKKTIDPILYKYIVDEIYTLPPN